MYGACYNILPTHANLARRKVPIDPSCAICGQAEEIVSHALWECPVAKNVRVMVKGKPQKCGARIRTTGGKTHKERAGNMGEGCMVYLECQELILLQKYTGPAK